MQKIMFKHKNVCPLDLVFAYVLYLHSRPLCLQANNHKIQTNIGFNLCGKHSACFFQCCQAEGESGVNAIQMSRAVEYVWL